MDGGTGGTGPVRPPPVMADVEAAERWAARLRCAQGLACFAGYLAVLASVWFASSVWG